MTSSMERRIAKLEGRVPAESWTDCLLDLLVSIAKQNQNAGPIQVLNPDSFEDGTTRDELTERIVGGLLEGADSPHHHVSAARIPDPLTRGMAGMVSVFLNTDPRKSPFKLERLRGFMADEFIAAIYDSLRNELFPAAMLLRVRQLAGVVDDQGLPLSGYILGNNGCIRNEIPPQGEMNGIRQYEQQNAF